MSKLTDDLRAYGCDMTGAMARFLDDEDFYASMYMLVLNDPAFERLGEALRAGDAHAAFEYAHLHKGLTGNMSFTPMYTLLQSIVEPLRAGRAEGLLPAYERLMQMRMELIAFA